MADVTVLGAGGATVTISLTSAQNAAAAQDAVNVINNVTKAGFLEMQIQAGAGTVPAPQNFLAGAIFTGSGGEGVLGDQYLFIGANGKGENVAVGGANFRTVVVAGNESDLIYLNSSRDGQVWYGKNNGTIANYEGKVTVETEDGEYTLVTDAGATSVMNLGGGGQVYVYGTSNDKGEALLGNATVNAAGGSTVWALADATIPATTINALGGMDVYIEGTAAAVINAGSSNVTVTGFPGASGATTLFGGSGTHEVYGGAGVLMGGSAGNNLMFSSTVAGSATLVAGSSTSTKADFLAAAGQNQTLDAGTGGNAFLYATADFGATGGSTFNIGAQATVAGFDAGGNIFRFSGKHDSAVDGRVEGFSGELVGNQYFDLGTTGGNILIDQFQTGLDTFQVTKDFNIFFFGVSETNAIETTVLLVTGGATYAFFDNTADGVQEIFSTDVTKVG